MKKAKGYGKKETPSFLEGIIVFNAKNEPVALNSLWNNCTVILKVLRRLGCPLCRYEARLLSDLKPLFDDLKIKLVAITFDEVGLQEFLNGGYWEWGLYVDKEKLTHCALGLTKQSPSSAIADIFSIQGRAAIKASMGRNIKGNFKGDGFQLGGTFVIKKDAGLVYEYRQSHAALYPSIKEIFKAAGGDPEDVEEQAPPECVLLQDPKDKK
ncbi:hypothetical protein K502DRAFT_158414 [Neoconidiobolus thromboides FSU 785]|nr:hypothetical protein K502DRAFT_158414 [Neoconidiobolus thromboides FSU 785]